MLRTAFSTLIVSLVALFATFGASAAIVEPGKIISYEFDLSARTSDTLIRFGFDAFDTVPDPNDPLGLGEGGFFKVSIGTSAGSGDILQTFDGNQFPVNVNTVSAETGLFPGFDLADDITTLFLTFQFVNDVFAIDRASLQTTGEIFRSTNFTILSSQAPPAVPLPGALPLLLTGLLVLVRLRKNRLFA